MTLKLLFFFDMIMMEARQNNRKRKRMRMKSVVVKWTGLLLRRKMALTSVHSWRHRVDYLTWQRLMEKKLWFLWWHPFLLHVRGRKSIFYNKVDFVEGQFFVHFYSHSYLFKFCLFCTCCMRCNVQSFLNRENVTNIQNSCFRLLSCYVQSKKMLRYFIWIFKMKLLMQQWNLSS